MGRVEIDRAVFIVVGRPRSIQIGIATTGFVSGYVGGVGVTVDILLVLPLDDALLQPVVVAVSHSFLFFMYPPDNAFWYLHHILLLLRRGRRRQDTSIDQFLVTLRRFHPTRVRARENPRTKCRTLVVVPQSVHTTIVVLPSACPLLVWFGAFALVFATALANRSWR